MLLPRSLVKLKYDAVGRPSEMVELMDGGLDTDVTFKKYSYPNNELVWSKRKVKSHVVPYSSEELEETTYAREKDKILKFPENFEQVAVESEEVREVIPIYE